MTVAVALYYFAIAFVLAQLEIQIEGPHGWAEKLPTWRWQTPGVIRWVGKPVTGYHVCLLSFILLFVHLPLLYRGFSWEKESETLSLFCLLTVFWDFLWFVCNPHFGLARFRPERVWWFKSWFLGLPASYFSGLVASAAIYAAGAFLPGAAPLPERAARWGLAFAALLAPTLATVAIATLASRRKTAITQPAND